MVRTIIEKRLAGASPTISDRNNSECMITEIQTDLEAMINNLDIFTQ
jgi:hypothetical protein